MHSSRFFFCAMMAVCVAAAVGCGSGQTDVKSLVQRHNDTNGKRLANFYCQYQRESGSAGPKDEKTLKQFIASRPFLALEEMGVKADAIDGLFVSERDKQPFVIRYGLPQTGNGRQALVMEAQGVSGKVQVIFTGPKVVEAAVSDLEAYKTGKKDSAGD